MRSGKDEAANAIILKRSGRILKFADPVYEVEEAFWKAIGLPIPNDKQVRRPILQGIGTEVGRNMYDKNVWIDAFKRRFKKMGVGCNIICTDCRFPNEAVALKELGFTLIKIECDDETRYGRGASHGMHPSETEIDNIDPNLIDFVVQNTDERTIKEWGVFINQLVEDNIATLIVERPMDWEGTLFENVGAQG